MKSTTHKVFIGIYYTFFGLFCIGVGMGIFNGGFFYPPFLIGVIAIAVIWGIALIGCIICGGDGLSGCGVYPFDGSGSSSSDNSSKTSSHSSDFSSSYVDDDFVEVYPTDISGNPMTDEPSVKIYAPPGVTTCEGDDGKKYERDTYGDGWHEVDD